MTASSRPTVLASPISGLPAELARRLAGELPSVLSRAVAGAGGAGLRPADLPDERGAPTDDRDRAAGLSGRRRRRRADQSTRPGGPVRTRSSRTAASRDRVICRCPRWVRGNQYRRCRDSVVFRSPGTCCPPGTAPWRARTRSNGHAGPLTRLDPEQRSSGGNRVR
ncbi:hypothetical protein HBB16_00760 [Pseudonocardia sp. MCCB 268]|nr:hypothetical protein [Pseudonocardia cytotoxica]